ncbi:hypothetical protein FA13DRAFT_1882227 [Coprinellus micaceus]|uniref:RRM domain-containing protein n=1 Tax=Coprinellus micaceus TaxID=71717 RepID=A0A4Y7TUG5_COPMI|nr:hypothetical protein FA13DRAFT_1882227 [Coprinellus micaceus]
MDDPATAFASHYPSYPFDLDMMKRSMEPVGGPDAKKARWSPNSTFSNQNPANAAATTRDAFANYGYGPQASINQPFNTSGAAAGAFGGSPLYSTPSLSINTQANGAAMGAQLSPNTAAAAFAVQQQQQQQQAQQPSPNGNGYAGFGGYNMLGMGLPAMNMLGSFPYNAQMANFNQAAAAYNPVALTAAMGATGNATGRTVYVGNLPATASVDELLNLVHFGPLESDSRTAAAFHADATVKKLSLHTQELKIGWGKPSPVPAQVALAISQSNASRNVYIGGLDENMTEEQLRDELSRFGLIDQVKIVRDKNIGFVHFLSISVATKVVNTLPTEPAWAGKRINFGKDRCAYIPKSQQVAAQQAQAAAAQSLVAQQSMGQQNGFSPFGYVAAPGFGVDMMGNGMAGGVQGMNRTVYLGNIHPETTTEDLCNAIRGGVLQSIRYMQDKHIAFVTFVDPAAAYTFFQVASYQGLTLNNRRLKVGWGKNAGPLPPSLALAVHSGSTRNVYIGNIEDFEVFNEEKLKRDFGEYGDIELVNFPEGEELTSPEYANLRIAHGKDRCANPPRSGPQGGSGNRRTVSGNGAANGNDASPSANEDVADASGDGYSGHEGEVQEMNIDGEHVNGHTPSA